MFPKHICPHSVLRNFNSRHGLEDELLLDPYKTLVYAPG